MFGRQITRKHLAVGAASAAVLGAALVPTFVMAQPAASVPSFVTGSAMGMAGAQHDGAGMAFHLGGPHGGLDHRGLGHGAALEEIATTLGVTVDALEDAMHEARQATRPTERPAVPPTAEEREARHAAFLAAVAEQLGVTPEALQSAIEAAQPTEEEIAAKHAEVSAALETRLAEQVAAGRITQEQADAVLERFDTGEGPVGPLGLGGPRGHRGHRGHGGPGFFQRLPATEGSAPASF